MSRLVERVYPPSARDRGGLPGRALWERASELVDSRELLLSVIRRDLTVRYKQSALGIAWALFVPVVSMAVFTVVFTRVAPLDTEVPYPVYVYAGLLPWTFFASALQSATNALTGNVGLVTKVYCPREVFPLAAVAVAFVDFLVASVVMGILMAYYDVGLSWTAGLIPIVIGVQVLFTVGLGLLLSMGNLYFRDVRYLVGVLLTIWMFSTSVVYPVERVGGRLGELLQINPMTPIIDAYRQLLLEGELPLTMPFGLSVLVALTVFLFSWSTFHRLEPRFAEVI